MDRFDQETQALRDQLNEVNTQWENRDIDPETTEAGFQAVADAHQALANEVAATTVPEPYGEVWPDTITLSLDLVTKTDAVIDGLNAPDDGTLRRQAVLDYNAAVDTFLAQLATVRNVSPTG
ncbi:MAG: hypothetical protein EHM57_05255 [Actinobacteria bacterium]|nr:MAG: hypothetical protein EHM57_05255 [Actinomycetota bacterium]